MLVLVLVTLLAMEVAWVEAKRPPILRPNYGTAMYHVGAIDVGASTWTHTFAIPWMQPKLQVIPKPFCGNHVTECKRVRQLIDSMDKQRSEAFGRISMLADIVFVFGGIPIH